VNKVDGPFFVMDFLDRNSRTLISNSVVYVMNEETFRQIFNGNYTCIVIYEGEYVNRSQMNVKRKTRDISTW
jgi:hypothetical protein